MPAAYVIAGRINHI